MFVIYIRAANYFLLETMGFEPYGTTCCWMVPGTVDPAVD